MKRGVLLVLVLAAVLILPGAARAQNPGGGLLITRVCGSNGCKSIFNGLFLIPPSGRAAQTTGPPPVGPFYVLEPSNYTSPEQTEGSLGPTTPAFFVPGKGLLRARPDPLQFTQQAWVRLPAEVEAELRAFFRRLEPFSAPRLSDVLIAGRETGEPESYAALYDAFPIVREPSPAGRGDPVAIVVRSGQRSPWTDGHNRIAYYPDVGLLYRDGQWVRPSAELVDRIERPTPPGGSVPWNRIGGIAGPLVLLGTIVALWFLTGRRRPRKLDATTEPQ
ncbi:MAG TPA: hypothetical protein VE693_08050 [Gaiellaceae bacterium]|jgi:hypothetical protein|nr:hypothetical protein [Gaiellaceae bacterium]